MKIYFNRRPTPGPWGGGSKVLFAIIDECLLRNHEVYFEEDIHKPIDFDILFCIDPRPSQCVNYEQLLNRRLKSPTTKLVQRIGDLGTHGKPELFAFLKEITKFPDALVFPSQWAKDYLNPPNEKCVIIKNAPLKQFLVSRKNKTFSKKLEVVSHHWSNNSLKGFDTYQKLDEYCKNTNKANFTFIGRKPDDVFLSNYIPPQDVDGLVSFLPKHDVYITASKQEAGANHVLEALALGLPVLYHKDGGSINEYCKDFGIEYSDFGELIDIIENKTEELQAIANRMTYQRSSKDMAREYVDLFEAKS